MKLSPSWIISWVIAIVLALTSLNDSRWETRSTLRSDMFEYYAYLPAAVIFNDLEFDFIWSTPADDKREIPLYNTPNGGRILKMTSGVALLELPFFLMAHSIAPILGVEANGYTWVYHLFMAVSAVFYASVTAFLQRKILLQFFTEGAVSLTLLAVFLGTNLFYYTAYEGSMSHVYSFFAITVFLLNSIKWVESFKWKNAIFTGLSFGLIVLIRPVNILVAIIPLLWGVRFFAEFMLRIRDVFSHHFQFFVIVFLAVLVWVPQLWYWHHNTGDWIYYSYTNQGFFFNDPRILEGLFGYRKGWLLYTPVAIFSVLGFLSLWLYKPAKKFKLAIPVYFLIYIYIIYSWWCWWYGGSFSSRPMIDAMAVLSVPMATFFTVALSRKYVNIIVTVTVFLLIGLNQFQTYQYTKGILHYDGMTKGTYTLIWGKTKYPPGFDQSLDHPDYDAALMGDRSEK